MSESNRTPEQKEYKGVYHYIEQEYKESWTADGIDAGFFSWTGMASKNRWEQFETNYRTKCIEYGSSFPSDEQLRWELETEAQKRSEDYAALGGIAEQDVVDVREDPAALEEIEQTFQERRREQEWAISDLAALDTFREMGMGVMEIEPETVHQQADTALAGSRKEKNQEKIDSLSSLLEQRAAEAGKMPEYLVRGAPLRCLYGSHMRYLDLHETHGVYLNDKPLIHQQDCEPEKHILSFGICSSPVTKLTEIVSLMKGADVDAEGNYLGAPDEQVLVGPACKPRIADGEWKNVKEDAKIAQDAAEGVSDPGACTCHSAATNLSYLICEHGGIIVPLSSGQIEYSAYHAAFNDYPYEDFGSDRFYAWCQQNDICPYHPQTKEYGDWHEKKITDLLHGMTKKKEEKVKKRYEDYLNGAYQYGLDRIPKEERNRVKQAVEEYLESGYLNEEEKGEVRERYAGLRMNYGYNQQKNILSATPKEQAFYQEYIQRASTYTQEASRLREELTERHIQEDYSRIVSLTEEIDRMAEQKTDDYERFLREIERYEDTLDEEQKRWADQVHEAFGKPSER